MGPATGSGRRRAPGVLLVAVVTATVAKVYLAATTTGTPDIGYWTEFALSVDRHGPVGIYGESHSMKYNHPPLSGWFLVLVNALHDLGVPRGLVLRLPACLADGVTAWLVYTLLRERHPERTAAAAAVTVVWSPVLLVVSGFHGNTDPVFVALTLGSFHLLTRGGRPLLAGVCLALAISVKLVPVVCLPWLLVLALRAGRATLLRFVVGGALVVAVLWVPVLATEWPGFRDGVLAYAGTYVREWGIGEFLDMAGLPDAEMWLAVRGSAVPLFAAYLTMVGLVTRRAHQDQVGTGLALVAMLLLSTAFGMQYLAWALAAAYLVSVRWAVVFNAAASVFTLAVYSSWVGGGPLWAWDEAEPTTFTDLQLALMTVTWLALLAVLVAGLLPGTGQRDRGDRVDRRDRGDRTAEEPEQVGATA